MENFLFQASIYLAAAVIAVPIAARLGLGSVLGYLAAGIIIGPVLGLVGSETQELQHVAEFGVVMMLFLIGLELDPRALWAMRHRLIGLGGAQVVVTTLVFDGGGPGHGPHVERSTGNRAGLVPVVDRDCAANAVRKGLDANRRWAQHVFRSADAGYRRHSDPGVTAPAGGHGTRTHKQRRIHRRGRRP